MPREERLMALRDKPMRITLSNKKGDWSETENWLKRIRTLRNARKVLEKYGREGVAALSAATPVDSGDTASSWNYEIIQNAESTSLVFKNNNLTTTGIPIAVLLQYGHGNGKGAYVQGRDYINPAIQPIFDKIANEAWKEVVG